MKGTLDFLVRHGYFILFLWVLTEQVGLPIPSLPLLLAAGALAGAGRLNLAAVILMAVLACLTADSMWFEIGKRRGGKVLNFLCRISLEPDSCVRRTEDIYVRHGARSLLVAKFIPGFSTIAPPLAGIFRMRLWRFLLFDGAGALLWASTFTLLGFLFSGQLERIAAYAVRLGISLVVLIFGSLAAYIGWKFIQRQRFLRELRIARITPEELKQMLDQGHEVSIVDLRHSIDFEADPDVIPGALHLVPEDLAKNQDAIPRDRDVILYCS
jgi:membrane protein DedA with SNARE-associated domain